MDTTQLHESISPTSSSFRHRDTGFPEGFCGHRNTSLPHPDAIPDATITEDDINVRHARARHRMSFQANKDAEHHSNTQSDLLVQRQRMTMMHDDKNSIVAAAAADDDRDRHSPTAATANPSRHHRNHSDSSKDDADSLASSSDNSGGHHHHQAVHDGETKGRDKDGSTRRRKGLMRRLVHW
ncbi:hypothetical protein B0T17DRAFT_503259 [Bombardia bombarda]|uniref:Uncharacterized protein n=1 Tax=Bombardia bombarda TaxID=252184 RepID=A0AA39XKU7_9PEZI|nr:hypothetical protein B0T17DRAFT_503259 [Bombardia bombarda]